MRHTEEPQYAELSKKPSFSCPGGRCWGINQGKERGKHWILLKALAFPSRYYLGLTWLTGMLSRAAISSTVSLPSEMMPTPLAMALAVIGWSPVTMITWNANRLPWKPCLYCRAMLPKKAGSLTLKMPHVFCSTLLAQSKSEVQAVTCYQYVRDWGGWKTKNCSCWANEARSVSSLCFPLILVSTVAHAELTLSQIMCFGTPMLSAPATGP